MSETYNGTVRRPNQQQLEEIRDHFKLNEQHLVVWAKPASLRAKPGYPVGGFVNGYHVVHVKGYRYHVPSIGWYLLHGVWPPDVVHYVDRTRRTCTADNLTLGRTGDPASVKRWAEHGVTLAPDGWYAGKYGPYVTAQAAHNARAADR